MEAEAKKVNWAVPILIVTMTALTLIAMVSWVQAVIGGGMSNAASFGGNGMMGAGGMMVNTANTGPANGVTDMNEHMNGMMGGGDMPEDCAKMQNDPEMKAIHDNCVKNKGSNSGNTQQPTNDTTNKTL